MVGELTLVAFLLYFAQKEARQLLNYKPRIHYFYDFSNVFEWFFLSLNVALVVTWLRFVFDANRVRGHIVLPVGMLQAVPEFAALMVACAVARTTGSPRFPSTRSRFPR